MDPWNLGSFARIAVMRAFYKSDLLDKAKHSPIKKKSFREVSDCGMSISSPSLNKLRQTKKTAEDEECDHYGRTEK